MRENKIESDFKFQDETKGQSGSWTSLYQYITTTHSTI